MQQRMHCGARGAGFTLIELLVVIAIIAVLAAMLFPVFARARAKARQAQCLSNAKQLALALSMYAGDYDGMMPFWAWSRNASPDPLDNVDEGVYTWDTVILPYMKNQQILICPSNDISRDARSYALPRYVSGQMIDAMPNPAATVCLFDKGAHVPGTWGDAAAENFFQTHDYSGGDLNTSLWHNGGKNFAYCDGHAKWSAKGAGPFAAFNSSSSCPGGYEAHEPGHCELPGVGTGDWPE